MYEIILGRTKPDLKKFHKKGCVLIGKQYVEMGKNYSLANPIYMDVTGSHAVLLCGKRGSGKSYTLGSITEGMSVMEDEVKKNLCFILLDTLGIYWTMKYKNEKDKNLLDKWGIKAQNLDVVIYAPGKFIEKYQKEGIPVDFPLYLEPKDISTEDWLEIFEISPKEIISVVISKAISNLLKNEENFDLDDIINEIEKGEDLSKEQKIITSNYFKNAKLWGIFSKSGTPIKNLLQGGKVLIIDLSTYVSLPGGERIKSFLLGIICKKIFIERVLIRKAEEKRDIQKLTQIGAEDNIKEDLPLPWLIIDEAHEFLPKDEMVPSSKALITILREGRQPGVSLVLATQQPGKIHTDAITQSDIVLSHRITAALDLEALDRIFLSYSSKGSKFLFNSMPRTKGCCIIADDKNEALHTMQVKPRISWHGGGEPTILEETKDEFDL